MRVLASNGYWFPLNRVNHGGEALLGFGSGYIAHLALCPKCLN